MDSVTPEVVAARRERLDDWRRDARADLIDLAQALGVEPPERLADHPSEGLPAVERMLRDEDLSNLADDAERWLAARLLVFVGEVLAVEHNGVWAVDADPESPTYGRYVVESGTMPLSFDPAAIVHDYLADPAPRSLVVRLANAEAVSKLTPRPWEG